MWGGRHFLFLVLRVMSLWGLVTRNPTSKSPGLALPPDDEKKQTRPNLIYLREFFSQSLMLLAQLLKSKCHRCSNFPRKKVAKERGLEKK